MKKEIIRCDVCEYKNSWDCETAWGRIPDDEFCDNFKLNFDGLSDSQKRVIQSLFVVWKVGE